MAERIEIPDETAEAAVPEETEAASAPEEQTEPGMEAAAAVAVLDAILTDGKDGKE